MYHFLQDVPTWFVVAVLLAFMLMANEIGFRIGRSWHTNETEHSRTVSNVLKGSIFGLVALLLGFSFSVTTNRYDLRQRIMIDQSNAIGTCYLRAGLLDETSCHRIQDILRRYLTIRVSPHGPGSDLPAASRNQAAIDQILAELWAAVEDASRREPERVHKSLLVPAANEVIDLSATRSWANRNHLPESVLILLFISVLVASLLLGHSSGQAQRRHVGLWAASNAVFALAMFVVLDFDRPQQGLIQVDQTPLVELKFSLQNTHLP